MLFSDLRAGSSLLGEGLLLALKNPTVLGTLFKFSLAYVIFTAIFVLPWLLSLM